MSNGIIYGGGGVIIGVLAATLLGGGASKSDVEAAVQSAMASAQEAQASVAGGTEAALSALSERLDGLEQAMAASALDPAALSAELSEKAQAGSAALAAKLDAMEAALGEKISGQSAALTGALAEITDGMASGAAAAVAVSPQPEQAQSAAMEDEDALGVGQAAVFVDGALRVFVSRIDSQSGSVRLSVNGDLTTLGVGGTTSVDVAGRDCDVTVAGLSEAGVSLDAACAAADTGAETAAETAAAEARPSEAPEGAIGPGQAVTLADGALRVFLSSVDEARGAARIAVNGVTTQSLAAGESVEVSSGDAQCTVTLTGVGGGQAGFAGSCG
jgi:hypothetical protein